MVKLEIYRSQLYMTEIKLLDKSFASFNFIKKYQNNIIVFNRIEIHIKNFDCIVKWRFVRDVDYISHNNK